jgi:formate hydrogenlyase subunit 3/multisubunit Na+/H+ antiporter MnhD subunit
MFAALGVSPFFTPDAKPLVLAGLIAEKDALPAVLMVVCNAGMTVFTLLAVHDIWLGRGRFHQSVLDGVHIGAARPFNYATGGNGANGGVSAAARQELALDLGGLIFPLFMGLVLAVMGFFGHQLMAGLAGMGGFNLSALPDFSPTWHSGVLLVYGGAFAAFAAGLFSPRLRNLLAAFCLALALGLIFADQSIAPLGRLFGVIVTGVGLMVTLYSWAYIHGERGNSYYFFLLLMFGSLAGLSLAESLGGFFVFWEIMTLSSYVLIAWEDTEAAHYSAKKYFLMCAVAAACMLPGLLLFFGAYGSLDISRLSLLAGPVAARAFTGVFSSGSMVLLAAVPILIGCGVKAGLVPGHGWLPDAHPAAPSSISAPLSGVLTKAGIFGLVQVLLVVMGVQALNAGPAGSPASLDGGIPNIGIVICLLGAITLVYGEVMALRQQDIKRLLAYSTMGQVGEIALTLGLFSWLALGGALLHVLNHAVMKDLLFLCSGALIMRAGSRNLKDLRGLGKAMPLTAACMVVGLLSILGLPPFAGFMSKYLMIYALATVSPLPAALLLLASLAGVIYYTRIIRALLFDPYKGAVPLADIEEAPKPMLAPMLMLAALCVIFGFFPRLGLGLVLPVLDSLAGDGKLIMQTLPALVADWKPYTLLLMAGAALPFALRRNPERAGLASALVLGVSVFLVLLDWGNLDTLSLIFALMITAVGCVNTVYAIGYLRHSHTQWRFYAFFLFMTAGLTGVAAAKDLFNFFLYWEIMSSWSLYFVIVHEENAAALQEGFKYFFFNVLGAAFIFLAVALLSSWCGSAEFGAVKSALPTLEVWQSSLAVLLLAIGFIMKAAQLPFRIDVQMHPKTAPTPVSGYISAVLLKSAIFGLAKLFLVLGGPSLLGYSAFGQAEVMHLGVWVGGLTIVMAALYAMLQSDFKLVLIYSTVSQLGYMVAAVCLGTSLGVAGGLLHLVNHVFFKDLLFLVCGAIIFKAHSQSMNNLGGLGRQMPFTMACFAVGAVCVIGLPPSSGFASKWIIYHALMEQGFVFVAVLSLVGSVLTLAYFAKVMHLAFFGKPAREMRKVREAPRLMLAPMWVLAAGCIITSVFPGLPLLALNEVLGQYGLAELDVAPWGLASGAGAWNATLTAILVLTVWLIGRFALRRLSGHQRVTDAHTCGIPLRKLNLHTTSPDIYSAPIGFLEGARRCLLRWTVPWSRRRKSLLRPGDLAKARAEAAEGKGE